MGTKVDLRAFQIVFINFNILAFRYTFTIYS